MASTVIGIFEHSTQVQKAQEHLLSNGFTADQIDIKTSSTPLNADNSLSKDDDGADGISGFFKNLFGDDDDEVTRYSEAGRQGTIVTVHTLTNDQADEAADILDECGAVDVNESLVRPVDSISPVGQSVANTTTANTGIGVVSDATSIPIIEEELLVGKRQVQTGGVRLKSRIIERPVEEHIRLRQEFVSLERTPVNKVATEADFEAFKEGTIEVTEHAEVAVVSKEAHVVEEISLRKDVEEKDEIVSDTVRSTVVEEEDISRENNSRDSGKNLL